LASNNTSPHTTPVATTVQHTCLKCSYGWREYAWSRTICPACGHLYVRKGKS